MTADRCTFCEWNYNGICTCDGIKPCYTLTFTADTDYMPDNNNTLNCASCDRFGIDCGTCENSEDE